MKFSAIALAVCLLSAALVSFSSFVIPVKASKIMTLYPIADAYVSSEHNSSNYGGDDSLYAQFWDYTYIESVRENSYLMFSLTDFSLLAKISSASLRLYAWTAWSPTTHIGTHQCSDTSWNEMMINWLNAPSFLSTASDVTAIPFKNTWFSWNVTDLVEDALGSRLTLVLRVEDTGDNYTAGFYSREGLPQYGPQLVIEFNDGEPPTYTSFHVSKDYVRIGDRFNVSIDLYDTSGISDVHASFLNQASVEIGSLQLAGSGGNGTYIANAYFGPTTGDGTYSIKIHAADGVGNLLETPVLGNITLDNAPPIILVLSPQNRTYSGNSSPLSFNLNEAAAWVGYSLDGQDNVTLAQNTTLSGLIDGAHYLIVFAVDNAGNTGSSSKVAFSVDTHPPSITDLSQIPIKDNVQPSDQVKINATIIDVTSGVKNVFLNYTVNDTAFFVVNMTKLQGNIYNATIPQLPYGTSVKYSVIAEDNVNNTITTEQIGINYQYSVIPEFPSYAILSLLMAATSLTIMASKRKLRG